MTIASDVAKHLRESSKASAQVLTEKGTLITVPHFLSTQHVGLDSVLGGGIPSGRITEIYSRSEGEGKSTLATHIIAECIRTGGLALLLDAEHGHTVARLENLGVDISNLIYVDPEYVEKAFQTIVDTLDYVDENKIGNKTLIVWDSIAATPPKSEIDNPYDKIHMASLARALSQGLKKIAQRLAKSNAYLVIINQTRQKLNTFGGAPGGVDTVGGKALKFYGSVRIQLNKKFKGGTLKDADNKIVGMVIEAQAVKNRIASPFQKTDMVLLFKDGIDCDKALFDFLLEHKMITQAGAWYSIPGHEGKFRQKDFTTLVLPKLPAEQRIAITTLLSDNNVSDAAIEKVMACESPS